MRGLEVVLPLKAEVFALVAPEALTVAKHQGGEGLLPLGDKINDLRIHAQDCTGLNKIMLCWLRTMYNTGLRLLLLFVRGSNSSAVSTFDDDSETRWKAAVYSSALGRSLLHMRGMWMAVTSSWPKSMTSWRHSSDCMATCMHEVECEGTAD